jgi:hypothetical protein
MTTEQEVHAFALAIAEIKNNGNFANILKYNENSILELTHEQ